MQNAIVTAGLLASAFACAAEPSVAAAKFLNERGYVYVYFEDLVR